MRDFMVDNILGVRRPQPQTQSRLSNLLAAFDAVEASGNTPPLSPAPFYQPMQQRSPCSPIASTSYENQQSTTKKRPLHQRFDSESSDDDQVHSPKKRKNPIELLCDDDETTEYQGEKNKGKATKSSNKSNILFFKFHPLNKSHANGFLKSKHQRYHALYAPFTR